MEIGIAPAYTANANVREHDIFVFLWVAMRSEETACGQTGSPLSDSCSKEFLGTPDELSWGYLNNIDMLVRFSNHFMSSFVKMIIDANGTRGGAVRARYSARMGLASCHEP